MSHSGILSVSGEDIGVASKTDFKSSLFDNELDFVSFFPPELSEKLFTYLPMAAVLECAKCCKAWRRISNSNVLWERLCSQSGYLNPPGETETDPNKWNTVQSHVTPDPTYGFCVCPAFSLPPLASLDFEPLCEYGLYWRQCRNLKSNWTQGRYVIQQLDTPTVSEIIMSVDCNGSLAAIGSCNGYVLICSVLGVPRLIHTIPQIRPLVVVQQVQLTKHSLVVQYEIGVVKIYTICPGSLKHNLDNGLTNGNPFELVAQIGIVGVSAHEHEYTLHWRDITDTDLEIGENDFDDAEFNNGAEVLIRELFRDEPWFGFGSKYSASNMFMLTTNELLVITGTSCNCYLIWELATGRLVRKVMLKLAFQVCFNMHMQITSDKLYLSSRKLINNVSNPVFYILVFSLDDLMAIQEIPSDSEVKDIQVEPGHQRMAWLTQESQETIFRKSSTFRLGKLILHRDYILFHEYENLIICVNWNGDKLYQIMAHDEGIVGIRCYKDFLISGGKELCVWNVHNGTKLQKIEQPCRISYLFAYETKIITVGFEGLAFLIGYW